MVSKHNSQLQQLHQEKIRSRKNLMRAREQGIKSNDGLCLAKMVDPEVFRRPLDLSHFEFPVKDED